MDRNKSPLKILGKVAVCVLRLSKFFRAPYIGRIAGHLCDSSAFFFLHIKRGKSLTNQLPLAAWLISVEINGTFFAAQHRHIDAVAVVRP